MKKTSLLALMIIALLAATAGCARQPSDVRCQKILTSYFTKYGKEYKETIYGQSKLVEVEITGRQEIHKNLIAINAFLTFASGDVRRIQATVERGPFGWRFVSWENTTDS